MRSKFNLLSAASMSIIMMATMSSTSQAQTTEDEVITVGTLIKREVQADRASPVANIGDAQIGATGAKNIADLTQTLTINTGSENNPDAFTQNATTGTSNINLRGLGVQSTLVLLNGRRQVLSAATNNGGYQFVDTASLVPMIAIDNVEILKDGASATYGSEAVAGVVNFSTFDNFDGVRLNANYQTVDGYDSDEFLLQAMVGKDFGSGNIMGAISFMDRSPLTTAEKRLSRPQDDTSILGNPGAFVPLAGPLAGAPLIDPGCAGAGGFPSVIVPNAALGLDVGLCGFDFGEFFNLVADEQRLTGLLQANYDLSDTISWSAEFTYADNETIRGNSPTFPFLLGGVVPATHPNYLPELSILAPTGSVFLGRASGNGGTVSPNLTTSETWRFSTELEGALNDTMDWRLSFTTGENNHVVATEDTVASRFRCALAGTCTSIGGPAGFFNPFASSFTTAPNDPAILDYIIDTQVRDLTSKLNVLEGVVTKEFENGAAFALGAQYRSSDYNAKFDAISNADDFGFIIGEQDYDGDTQNVFAIFGEAFIPVSEWIEIQLAGRYEDYGNDVGSTFDPKLAILARPTDTLSVRGSISTSFRSPTVYQQFGQGTALTQVTDPTNGGSVFIAARTLGSQTLDNETSTATNIGFSWEPVDNLELDVDYYTFDFEDVIIPENPQAVVNAFPNDPLRVIRNAGGSIVQVNTNYVNAGSLKTNGIDFSARYTLDADFGTLVPFIEGTVVTKYELDDPQAGIVDGLGERNFANFGTSSPKLRYNAGFAFQKDIHTFNAFMRYIDSYGDDQNGGLGIDSHRTFDVQYKVNFGELLNIDMVENVGLTLGAINVTDEDPPQVFTNGGFDSKVHDPRGRLLYIGADIEF